MARIIFLVSICVFAGTSSAQQIPTNVDSLRKVLLNHTQEDSVRVNILLSLSYAITYNVPTEAKQYAEEALQLSKKIHWQAGIARSYGTLGSAYHAMSDYGNAIDNFLEALKAGEYANSKKFLAGVNGNIAMIYAELSDFDKALEGYQKALALARELHMGMFEAISLMNIGVIEYRQYKFQQAMEHYQQSLVIAEDSGYVLVAANVLSNMGLSLTRSGETFVKQENFTKALACFEKSLEYAEKIGDARSKTMSFGGMGQAFIALGDYEKAERYAKQSIEMAKQLNILQPQYEGYMHLRRIYEKQAKYQKAVDAYTNEMVLKDSILSDDKRQEITRKEIKFEFERKEAAAKAEQDKREAIAAEQLNQQRIQNNSVMGGASLLLIAGATSFLFYKKRRDADEQRKRAEFNAQVAETEMKALRSQMNPHFIFNALNSISDYLSKHDTAAADYFLAKFAKLMRMILEHSERQEITLAEDLEALELYMQLEAKRLSNKFTYEIAVAPELDKQKTMIPPMLLQPFVENSIWHGISPKEGAGKITIRIEKEEKSLRCTVEDDGVGRAAASFTSESSSSMSREKKRSLGVQITKARVAILNEKRKANATVELFDLAQGTKAEVMLPLLIMEQINGGRAYATSNHN